MLGYLEKKKWGHVAQLRSRLRVYYLDVSGCPSANMVSAYLSHEVGETLTLHPALLVWRQQRSAVGKVDDNGNATAVVEVELLYALSALDLTCAPPATSTAASTSASAATAATTVASATLAHVDKAKRPPAVPKIRAAPDVAAVAVATAPAAPSSSSTAQNCPQDNSSNSSNLHSRKHGTRVNLRIAHSQLKRRF